MVRDSLFEKRFKDFIESIKSSHKKYVKNNKNINYSIVYYTILYYTILVLWKKFKWLYTKT